MALFQGCLFAAAGGSGQFHRRVVGTSAVEVFFFFKPSLKCVTEILFCLVFYFFLDFEFSKMV
jgi:hypothetical protein